MALLSKVQIDDDGVWLTYYEGTDDEADMEICVGSSSSPSYKSLQRKLARQFAKKGSRTGFTDVDMSEEETQVMLATLGAELVKDWRGFDMTQGHYNKVMGLPAAPDESLDAVMNVNYSPAIALSIMSHPGFQHMLDFVTMNGANAANHVKKQTEDDVGNSQTASSST